MRFVPPQKNCLPKVTNRQRQQQKKLLELLTRAPAFVTISPVFMKSFQ
jgi:hypothetical protein